jgi:S-formylglutathione hydrolase FrmB
MFNGLTSAIISLGLDTLRSQLVATLMMTAGSALIGAALGRRKLGAFVGAGIVFCNKFLISFFQYARQPLLDPGGHPEPVSMQALYTNSAIILGLGLLSGFIGLAIGITFGEVVLDPPYRFLCFCWQYCVQRFDKRSDNELVQSTFSLRKSAIYVISRWFSAAVIVILIVLAANSANLFIFSPDIGIHTRPVFLDSEGKVVTGRVVTGSLISSSLKNQRRVFDIYLPPSYNTREGEKKYYPTLYLLHGAPGRYFDWVVGGEATESANTLIALKSIPELIMVFPDGNGAPGMSSEWSNSYDGHQLMENFVVYDLVKYVDQHYRTIPDAQHRAIGGLSMGGFGAMNMAIHHPDIFGNVISLGGYYKAEGSSWGSNISYRRLNSPLDTILAMQEAWQLHIFLGAATKDQPYYQDTLQFMRELNSLHIRYHFDLQVGQHSWRVWQKQTYDALEWLPWNQQLPIAHTKMAQRA